MVFSKFKNKKKKNSAGKNTNTEEVFRVRTPRDREVIDDAVLIIEKISLFSVLSTYCPTFV